jgi:hypothetical protein
VATNFPYLAVFSAPRSGSNHFFDLLAARNGLVNLNEFFGRRPAGLTKELRAASLVPFGDWESFSAVAREHPVETLKFLEDMPGAHMAAIKIQPRHLGIPHPVTEFVAASEGNIFLRRNPLAVWISRRTVKESKAWEKVNTEKFQVPFEPQEFCSFTFFSLSRLKAIEEISDSLNRPKWRLSYREIENFAGPQEMWDTLTKVFPHVPVETMDPDAREKFVRQDSRRPFDRLSNPDEAQRWLEAHGLDSLIDNSDDFDANAIMSIVKPLRSTS